MGKHAQARFNTLIKEHKAFDEISRRASGISQECTEKIVLLDELTVLVDELSAKEASKTEAEKKKQESNIAAGAVVRDEAARRLKHDIESVSDGEKTKKKKKSDSYTDKTDALIEAMKDDSAREMESRMMQWNEEREERLIERAAEREERKLEREADRAEKKRERDEDREERLELAKLENERFLKLFQMFAEMKKA